MASGVCSEGDVWSRKSLHDVALSTNPLINNALNIFFFFIVNFLL